MQLTGKIAILGFGREGMSTYKYLSNQGISDITILDGRAFEDFSVSEREVLQREQHQLGASYLDTLDEYDTIIKTPGISPYHEKILPYRHKITSQTQLFFDIFPGRVIAVTGTKGKSTTTSLIYTILKTAGYNVGIVGNIGNPVLDSLDAGYDTAVFEMSSYMLDGIQIDPEISVLINIYREHLDYHQGFENYKNAKLSIIGPHTRVIASDELRETLSSFDNSITFCGSTSEYRVEDGYFCHGRDRIASISDTSLLGEHNQSNILYAIAVAQDLGIESEVIQKSLREFHGLPHRLEYVMEKNGIVFYDDAISTTPESTLAALRSIENIDTIFLGGSDRGYDFHELLDYLVDSEVQCIVFFPETGIRMLEELQNLPGYDPDRFAILETKSMADAVDFAFQHTRAGHTCLLSCASPSYSLWKNFEVKGDEFKKYVVNHS